MAFQCYKCKQVSVPEEFTRCPSCETAHKALAQQLDSRPKVIEKKPKEKLYAIKQMKNGVLVTTYIDRNDAFNMGIKVEEMK